MKTDSVMVAMLASAAIFGRGYSNGRRRQYFEKVAETNPLSEATRERIANEAITKAEQRQARRLARKQADRERTLLT